MLLPWNPSIAQFMAPAVVMPVVCVNCTFRLSY